MPVVKRRFASQAKDESSPLDPPFYFAAVEQAIRCTRWEPGGCSANGKELLPASAQFI
jgi:hypothetical protein